MLPNQYYLYYPETGEIFTLDKWEAYNLLTKYNLTFSLYYQHCYDEHKNYFTNVVYAIDNVEYCIIVTFDELKHLLELLLHFDFSIKTNEIKVWNHYFKNILKNHKCEDSLEEFDWHKNRIIYKCEICGKEYYEDDDEIILFDEG